MNKPLLKTDSVELPYTLGIGPLASNNIDLLNASYVDMDGDGPARGQAAPLSERAAVAYFPFVSPAEAPALKTGVMLSIPVKNGKTYLLDCLVDGPRKAYFKTVQVTPQAPWVTYDESSEMVQNGHLLFTYLASSGDGWIQVHVAGLNDPSPGAYTQWSFQSCKVTPLSS